MMKIRFADPVKDSAALLEIYRPYIEKTAITFETAVPDVKDYEKRIADIAAQFPYLVLENGGEIVGYAYAHRQAERAAFDWNAELSIYLKESFSGRGIGRPLYALLETLLKMQGYVNFFGVITGSNAGSIAMHEKMGYKKIAVHEKTGFKFGAWHDTVWMHKRLSEGDPREIVRFDALCADEVRQLIQKTEKKIEEKMKITLIGMSCCLVGIKKNKKQKML